MSIISNFFDTCRFRHFRCVFVFQHFGMLAPSRTTSWGHVFLVNWYKSAKNFNNENISLSCQICTILAKKKNGDTLDFMRANDDRQTFHDKWVIFFCIYRISKKNCVCSLYSITRLLIKCRSNLWFSLTCHLSLRQQLLSSLMKSTTANDKRHEKKYRVKHDMLRRCRLFAEIWHLLVSHSIFASSW